MPTPRKVHFQYQTQRNLDTTVPQQGATGTTALPNLGNSLDLIQVFI